MYVDMKDEIPRVAIFTKVGRTPVFTRTMGEVSVNYILTTEEQYFFFLTRQTSEWRLCS